jgi:hypothetical protein
MEHSTTGEGIEAIVRRSPTDGSLTIQGRIQGLGVVPQIIEWIAAAPVTRGIGFSGSGMPYPNRDIAVNDTPHKGVIESPDGSFNIKLQGIPAGYYAGLGSVYVPPMVEFTAMSVAGKRFRTSLWINDTAAPFRWIAGSPATMKPAIPDEESLGRAMYYFGREQMPLFDNQEAQLRAKGYPGDMTGRGWPEPIDAQPWSSMVPPS